MHPTHCYKSLYQLLFVSITICITLPCFLCSSVDDPQYVNCTQPFECGNPSILGDLKYPFWGINRASYCGKPGFKLRCLDNTTPVFNISTLDLQLIETNPEADKITVVFNDFANNVCPSAVFNRENNTSGYKSFLSLNSGSLFVNSTFRFLTIFYGCQPDLGNLLGWLDSSSCSVNNTEVDVHFVTQTVNVSLATGCESVVSLPIPEEKAQALGQSTITLPKALDDGFDMNWLPLDDAKCRECVGTGGQCGYNRTTTLFTCYCPDKPYALYCPPLQPGQHKKMVSIAAAVAAGIVILGFLIFFSKHFLQKCKPISQDQSVEDCLKSCKSTFPGRYTYANVKKMTNSFKQKLGEGGYGSVFKGSLHDGRAVAVKVWKQSKGDGQDFVNEVTSISRTSHVNIVSLLGFCFEGPKRALIYEFMPNGSLEKFIRVRDSNDNILSLSTPKLLEIVVGIARGLEYLHRGCNTRIVHFDIKPHNILLDSEFTPKISDFGLAKSYKQKESIISMSEARGTIGYIAPEVILRSFGGVSHKSDVYSFGMMTLEMVGCTKRLNNQNVENSSEIYFPQWIYQQLEQETILDSAGILNEEEREMERKMILVGLWCIQTNPMVRPSMSRVVEMLEGEVDLLQVPPLPSLASPPRQQQTDDGSCSFDSSTCP